MLKNRLKQCRTARKLTVKQLSERSGMTVKDTEQALEALLGEMYTALAAGERVLLTGFGTFEPKRRAERMGCIPVSRVSET